LSDVNLNVLPHKNCPEKTIENKFQNFYVSIVTFLILVLLTITIASKKKSVETKE